MATTAALTGNLVDLVGDPLLTSQNVSTVSALVETNIPGDAIIDTVANKIHLGAKPLVLSSSGTFSAPLITTNSTGINPSGFQYQVRAKYRGADGVTKEWASGWFSFTAAADLADKVPEALTSPNYVTQLTAQLDAHAAALEAGLAKGPQGVQGTPGTGSVNLPELLRNLITNPSFETGTAGWAVFSASIAQSTAQKRSGAASLLVTNASSGGDNVYTTIAVEAGKTYTVAAYFWTGSSFGRNFRIYTGQSSGSITQPPVQAASVFQRVVHTFTATATDAALQVYFSMTGAVATWHLDDVLAVQATAAPDYFDGTTAGAYWTGTAHTSASVKGLHATTDVLETWDMPELARNLYPYPSFETADSAASATGASVGRTLADQVDGKYALYFHTPTQGNPELYFTTQAVAGRLPVTGGKTYTFAVSGFQVGGASLAQTMCWYWYDSNGTRLTDTYIVQPATSGALQRFIGTATAPAGAVGLDISMYYPGNAATSTHAFYFDGVTFTETDYPVPYFDGDKPGCRWVGKPHASQSIKSLVTAPDFARFLRGIGSPEGKVSAPVGVEYVDDAATNGAVKWIKASGTGNTGWKVVYGDTGLRNINGTGINGWSIGYGRFRRMGNTVSLALTTVVGTSATSDQFLSLPLGFRATATLGFGTGPFGAAGGGMGPVELVFDDRIWAKGRPGSAGTFFGEWLTGDPWPTTLPGTPA